MRIRILVNTNIRSDPRDFSKPPIGVIYSGVELEVESQLFKGVPINGVDVYFRDLKGWYYWSGQVAILYKELPSGRKETSKKPEPPGERIGGRWKMPVSNTEPEEEFSYSISERESSNTQHSSPKGTKEEPSSDFSDTYDRLEVQPEIEKKPEPRLNNKMSSTGKNDPRTTLPLYSSLHPFASQLPPSLDIQSLFWDQYHAIGSNINIAFLDGQIDTEATDLQDAILHSVVFNQRVGLNETEQLPAAQRRAWLIAGRGNTSRIGIAPGAQILPMSVMNQAGRVYVDRLIEGLRVAIAEKCDLVFTSASLQENELTAGQRRMMQDIVQQMRLKGIQLIAPVGDGNNMNPENRYPARLSNCLSVGSLALKTQRALFSLKSQTLDLVAPGEELYQFGQNNSPASTADSAALVTGIMALLLEVGRKQNAQLKATHLKSILRGSAVHPFPSNRCRDLALGCGIINPQAALNKLER